MDRDSALWKNVKDKLYPDGLIRGKEGEKKRQQLAEIDAEYAKEQKKGSSEKNGNKRDLPAVEDNIIPAAEYKFDTASDLLATTAGAVFLVGQEPALSRQMVELVKEKMILHTGKAITPFLNTEKELYLTKIDLTSAFKKTATLHKRLGSIYTKIGKKNPHYADMVPKHMELAAANLAAADTASKEAADLQEKYGFTVSRSNGSEFKTAASPKLTPVKRAAVTPEQSPAKKQTPTHYYTKDVLKEKYGSKVELQEEQDEENGDVQENDVENDVESEQKGDVQENGVESEEGSEQKGDVENGDEKSSDQA